MERECLLHEASHPIFSGRYEIPTVAIANMLSKICDCVECQTPGIIVYGPPRLGKTRAIRCMEQFLPQRLYPTCPVITVSCSSHVSSYSYLSESVLKALKHELWDKGKVLQKSLRTVNALMTLAYSANSNRIIVIFDEANNLLETDYESLIDIYNQLDYAGINMTVVLVGTNELYTTKCAFREEGKQQIVGRFMIQEHIFHGLQNIEEMAFALDAYDRKAFFPKGSDCSFVRYFFPDAVADNYTLKSEADTLYKLFYQLRTAGAQLGYIELPMQYFIKTVDICFRKYGKTGEGVFWPNIEMWKNAISLSGYLEAEKCLR